MPVDEQDFQARRQYGFAIGGKHLPVEGHCIAQRPDVARNTKMVAGVADVLFVRTFDPEVERFVSKRLSCAHVVHAVSGPEPNDRLTTAFRIRLATDGDVTIGEVTCCVHDTTALLTTQHVGVEGLWAMMWEVKK